MDLKIAYYARNSAEATAVQKWLEDAGIESSVQNDAQQAGAFDLGMETDPQVVVAEKDFEAARKVVEQYEAELHQETDMSEMSDAEGQFDWPQCPQCDELRHATCEHCGYVGSEFTAANRSATESENTSLCLACNNPTGIQFQGNCKFCGHDFALETGLAGRVPQHSTGDVHTGRVLVVIGGIVVLLVIMLVWFLVAAG